MSCITVAQVRAVWPNPDPDLVIPDDEISTVISEVCDLYAGELLGTSKLRPRAVELHVAHILYLTLNWPGGAAPFGAPIAEGDLDGVGKLKFAVGNLNPGDIVDLLKMPSPYIGRLMMQRHAMPPGLVVV